MKYLKSRFICMLATTMFIIGLLIILFSTPVTAGTYVTITSDDGTSETVYVETE